ncbi:MAG TPA: hypothetical protein VHY21_04690, partial [Pseudonocardiaceae bacterium]|nr:hypothetical protein [Pseudonocardiaceae bacterium]
LSCAVVRAPHRPRSSPQAVSQAGFRRAGLRRLLASQPFPPAATLISTTITDLLALPGLIDATRNAGAAPLISTG